MVMMARGLAGILFSVLYGGPIRVADARRMLGRHDIHATERNSCWPAPKVTHVFRHPLQTPEPGPAGVIYHTRQPWK